MKPDGEFFERVFEESPLPTWLRRGDGRIVSMNEAARALLGVAMPDEPVGVHDAGLRLQAEQYDPSSEGIRSRTWTLSLPGGEPRELRTRSKRITAGGQTLWLDIVDLISGATELERDATRELIAAQQPGDWEWRVDRDGVIVESSPVIEQMLGYRNATVIGSSIFDYYFPESREKVRAFFNRLIESRSGWTNLVQRVVDANGAERFLETSARPVFDAAGEIVGFSGVDREISEHLAVDSKEKRSWNDVLTGLPLRGLFLDRLEFALAHARRSGHGLAVFFIDIDHFKLINDTFGHSVGDDVLRVVASSLRALVREEDTVARFGGDEFTLLLMSLASRDEALRLARKIQASISQPLELSGTRIYVTVSIGISMFPEDGADGETLLRNADNAMYRVKELGRNDVRLFTPDMGSDYVRRLTVESGLRQAIDRGELQLHYQPIFSCADERVVGVEALLRWTHPVDGIVAPSRFIDVAEASRVIIPIGEWVIEQACRDLRGWLDAGIDLRLAVNVSPSQLAHKSLVEHIRTVLDRTGLAPDRLELEIIESAAMQNPEITLRALVELRDMGLRLALDDFGTGYSSLAHLHRFPIDTVKVDQAFVHDINREGTRGNMLVSAILALSRGLGLRTVGEGVENVEQLEFLRRMRCDEVQGFYLAEPVPADELVTLLRKRQSA
jgi:diguanylate cyclase (GGDEF)-like protein/PAS domain S-box-containing protein